tara:strand:- start:1496 stop:2125 length:630 start_codon:yes stop_codon:yes gene_type:complete
MAYPTVDAPYGLIPINLIGGTPYAGSTRQITIASGYNTNIFFGDVVKRVADATLEKDTGTSTTATTGVIGVFMGCTFTDPNTNTKTFKQFYPANTAASDIKAYVADDPNTLYKVAVVSSGTTIAGTGYTSIGSNAALVQNAGSTVTGNSKVAINGIATTLTLPMRIVDVVEETADSSGNFTEVIVKWNAPYEDSNISKGGHAYHVATGL